MAPKRLEVDVKDANRLQTDCAVSGGVRCERQGKRHGLIPSIAKITGAQVEASTPDFDFPGLPVLSQWT